MATMAVVERRFSHEHLDRRTHQVASESSYRRRSHVPLRRGDACLMCRAKKLKCSATKPACDQCIKRKDKCIYDSVRPASRVEKLERKLAEIEAADLQAAFAVRRHSGNGLPGQHDRYDATGFQSGFQTYQFLDPNNSNLPYSIFHSADTSASSTSPEETAAETPSLVDISTLEGQWWAPPGAYGSTAAPWDTSNLDLSTWGNRFPPAPMPSATLDVNAAVAALGLTPALPTAGTPAAHTPQSSSAAVDPLAALGGLNFDTSLATNIMGYPAWVEPPPTGQSADWINLPLSVPGKTRLEESDISQAARDYLLELFFSSPRQQFGSEVFTEAQFRAKLTLPPAQQQHPCLLFAMYGLAANTSFIPGVRGLSDSLMRMALERVEQSVRECDRVLDAINAIKVMIKCLVVDVRQGGGHGVEVYDLLMRGVGLVKSCKLDQIKSSTWTGQERAEDWPILGPPKDQWDLVERIHAFWGIWANERASTMMLSWRPILDDAFISTPLPWRAEDYFDGTISSAKDLRIMDAYLLPERGQALHYAFGSVMIAVHLCARAKYLRTERPEAARTLADLARRPRDYCAPARDEYPAAYKEIMGMVEYFSSTLPRAAVVSAGEHPSIAEQRLSTNEGLLLSARLHLHNSGHAADRPQALAAAHDIASMVPIWGERVCRSAPGGEQSHSTVRNRYGVAGPYGTMAWFWATDVLVRSARELRAEADAGAGTDADSPALDHADRAARRAEADQCVASIATIAETLRALGIGWGEGARGDERGADVEGLTGGAGAV
ncbi:hypothetical protein Q5752_003782 [Cryptotrichosporon argae]